MGFIPNTSWCHSMREGELIRRIMLRASENGVRLWRNNCGMLQDAQGRWVRYGVCNPGGSDLIGFTPVEIHQGHVGSTLAIFTAVEAKTGRLKPTQEQESFLRAVEKAGGIAKVVREGDV